MGLSPLTRQVPEPGPICRVRANRSFGTDLLPCDGLQALLDEDGSGLRIGVFDDLRRRTTSTFLVIVPEDGEPYLAERCPACGTPLQPADAIRAGGAPLPHPP